HSIVASSTGKIQRRRIKADGTPENVPLYPHEISSRLSDLSLLDFSGQPVPGAKYDDLDPLERERLRKILLSNNGEKSLLELSDEELDKALQFVISVDTELVPTYAGMLMIGKADSIRKHIPTAESAIIEMKGTEVTANDSFYGPLLSTIEKVVDFISVRNSEQEMDMGMFRISIPDFDKRAVREAIVNAFSHRDYSRMGRVIVRLDADGLSISNPGGFIEGVSISNLLSIEPHGRNPILADALKRIGLAERSGRGVDRIYEGSLRYGRDLPDYSESTATSVKLFIPRSIPDKHIIEVISAEQKRTGIPMPLNAMFALHALKENRRLLLTEICQESNIPESKMRSTMEYLVESGLVEAVGNGKSRAYVFSSKVYKNPIQYVRQTDIDSIRYKELIVKLADTKEWITRGDVIELLHVSKGQAYRLLKKLTNERVLIAVGNTSAAKYKKNSIE
ncbi:MAG: ATP-binding protein, partial [Bacillota bacterium]|nr:ATP-binding protein [Bacillota bacterium]